MQENFRQETAYFKALSDPNRLRILQCLQKGPRCACELLTDLDLSQPTLSHHMRVLCEAGVVVGTKEGKWMHYRLDPSAKETGCRMLKHFFGD